MSRVCVKNLPLNASEEKLKEHFGAQWEVTDGRIMRTRDGRSRRFGFVGFRCDEDALAAIKYFNKSYLGTSRLICEVAHGVGDDTAAHSKTCKPSTRPPASRSRDEADDPQLAAFLDAMQPRKKAKLWENDSGPSEAPLEKKQADEKHFEDTVHEVNAGKEEETLLDTGRLYVRNLAYTTSEEDLTDLFKQFGELSQVHLVLDKETNRSKGFAYVHFHLPECATRALKKLDKSIFQGRLIHILPAQAPPSVPPVAYKPKGTTTFKQEKAQRKKLEQNGGIKGMSSLYTRPDTAVENVAGQFGVSKSDFLDPQAQDLGVRVALAEAHVIAETKKEFKEQGLDVNILADGGAAAGSRVLLVKNLPFSTTEEELRELFGRFGTVTRLVLPSTKTSAIVEFLEAREAGKTFRALTLNDNLFKHQPLFPQKLSDCVLQANEDKGCVRRTVVEDQLLPEEDEAGEVSYVHVKNLSFKTTEARLRKHFEAHVPHCLRSVTVVTKPSKAGGKCLSRGFGFLEFNSAEMAQHVCKTMQGTVLDGHALVLRPGHMRKPQPDDIKAGSTKIIVRNVAFEATRKDLKQLFSPFGQIKSLRLPKRFDEKHRGFAFVEFLSKQEAKNAFAALASVHLYGRHLVLEWARE